MDQSIRFTVTLTQSTVKVTRGQKVKIVFANNSVQSCLRESGQKLKCSLFNFVDICKYDYGSRIDSFKH